jgi:hypothetical protein
LTVAGTSGAEELIVMDGKVGGAGVFPKKLSSSNPRRRGACHFRSLLDDLKTLLPSAVASAPTAYFGAIVVDR